MRTGPRRPPGRPAATPKLAASGQAPRATAGDAHEAHPAATGTPAGTASRTAAPPGAACRAAVPPSAVMLARASRIDDQLFLGGFEVASHRPTLRHLGITHVINAAQELENCFAGELVYFNAPVMDRMQASLTPFFQATHAFIEAARATGGRVLIHCQHGVSRSATVTLAHLMLRHQLTLAQSFAQLRAARPEIEPNRQFLQDLRDLERQLLGQLHSTAKLTRFDAGTADPADAPATLRQALRTALAGVASQAAVDDPAPAATAALLQLALQVPQPQRPAFLQALLTASWEDFGSLQPHDLRVHAALGRLLAHWVQHGWLSDTAFTAAIAGLTRDTERWGELEMDTPHARQLLQLLLQQFARGPA